MQSNAGSIRPTVTFLCPAFVTGGPEAVHQASMAFRSAGLRSQIAFYPLSNSQPERAGDRLFFDKTNENPCLSAFAHYEPEVVSHIEISEDAVIVLPEVLIGRIDKFLPARVVVWWLSVDNALITCPILADPQVCQAFFEQASIEHWYQSDYARRFLIANGTRSASRLTDFTDRTFTPVDSTRPNPGSRVLFNRRKGAALAQRFFSSNPQFEPVALDGLCRDDLIAAYRSAPIYIDFGTLPGKDRMPREAAACGCTIFLHQVGAGREIGDFPVHDIFRFGTDEVNSGQLAAKLRLALVNPSAVWALQAVLRETIRREQAEFQHEAALIAENLKREANASRLRLAAA